MEWLNDGQHNEKYCVEAWQHEAWKSIACAHAIGHEKIGRYPAVTATRVRLNILSGTGAAAIREFQLYEVQGSDGSQ
jgi:alpha-L-fucosidase